MEKKKYLVPPKLQSKLLLANLTVTELGIAFGLGFAGFFSTNKLNAIYWAGIWILFVMRLFRGKSLVGILQLMIRYHFVSPQQFVRTRRVEYEKKQHGSTDTI